MLKKYTEYREMQQLRKDHIQKQKMQYGIVLFSILMVLLLAMAAIESMAPAKPVKAAESSKTVPAVSTISSANQQEIQEIEAFADAVTKSADELTKDDFALVDTKADDPCYEKNAMLPQEQMVEAIKACKHL